jgi:hypothetical protein
VGDLGVLGEIIFIPAHRLNELIRKTNFDRRFFDSYMPRNKSCGKFSHIKKPCMHFEFQCALIRLLYRLLACSIMHPATMWWFPDNFIFLLDASCYTLNRKNNPRGHLGRWFLYQDAEWVEKWNFILTWDFLIHASDYTALWSFPICLYRNLQMFWVLVCVNRKFTQYCCIGCLLALALLCNYVVVSGQFFSCLVYVGFLKLHTK